MGNPEHSLRSGQGPGWRPQIPGNPLRGSEGSAVGDWIALRHLDRLPHEFLAIGQAVEVRIRSVGVQEDPPHPQPGNRPGRGGRSKDQDLVHGPDEAGGEAIAIAQGHGRRGGRREDAGSGHDPGAVDMELQARRARGGRDLDPPIQGDGQGDTHAGPAVEGPHGPPVRGQVQVEAASPGQPGRTAGVTYRKEPLNHHLGARHIVLEAHDRKHEFSARTNQIFREHLESTAAVPSKAGFRTDRGRLGPATVVSSPT
jgi:hypothetical protein